MQKPFLQLVAEDIKSRFGNEIAEIAVVFNNKRPMTYLKKHLVDTYGQAIWSPQFYTVQNFFALSSDKIIASPLTQFFYLYQLNNQLLEQAGEAPETPEEFYPIAEIILSDFDQLDYELIPVDHIYMELFEGHQIDVAFQHLTAEQQQFIKQFWQSFSIQGHTAVQERFLRLWKRLPTLYRRFKERLANENQTRFPSIYRDLAEDQSAIQAFTKKFKKILFVGFNALNRAEEHLFKHWQDQDHALFYFDSDRYYLDDSLQEAGLFLRRNLHSTGLQNALGERPNILGTRRSQVYLNQCMGKNAETKLLHDHLLTSLAQESESEQTTAILLADESLLVPLLQSLPDTKVNITTGYPLTQSPLYGLLDLWMEIQLLVSQQKRSHIPFQLLEIFLSHPLIQISSQQKDELQRNMADKQLFEVALHDIEISTATLPHFFHPTHQTEELVPSLLRLVDDLLIHLGEQTKSHAIETNLLVEIKKTLNQLVSNFEQIATLNLGFQLGLIKKALLPINAAIEGDQLSGIQIMGLLESRCLNFDRVFILGANEGVLPQTSNSLTFIPTNLRRAYGLPVLENQDALSAYLFYRHFQYSDEIHLFYNGIIDESSSGEESRFIKQLEFESNFHFIRRTHQQPLLFPHHPEALVIEKNGAVWDQMARTYLQGEKSISASAFTSYLYSPLQFFFKYVAEIKEPPSISQEFEMNRLGTVIHNCMERLLTPYKNIDDLISTHILQEATKRVELVVFQEIIQQYQLDYTKLDELSSLHRIMHKISSEYIHMYLAYDMAHYQSFRIIELENTNDYFLDFEIQIDGKPEIVKLYGIIDRIDEVITHDGERKLRIVDYKTGADTVLFANLDKVYAMNTDNKALIQTLFYAHVYEQKSGILGLEPHLYVARRMREEGTVFTNKRGNLRMHGSFLEEQKAVFVDFLRKTLEEIFNPQIPFQHHPGVKIYPSDPYTLFYKNSTAQDAEDNEQLD
ncbi:MAG: PD-(D/E)XK nuclease family protein [Sphingobacterium sp.]